MRKKNYKGRTEKRSLGKCKEVFRFYSDIQSKYADMLQEREDIMSFQGNVLLDGNEYTTDFLCIKSDGDYMVRECIERKVITKPMNVKLLDISRAYWMKRGVEDWGIVVDAE